MKKLVIRADAGGELGTGHVMRMIALAQAYMRRGGSVIMLSVQCPKPVVDRVVEVGIDHHILDGCELGNADDSAATLQWCKKQDAEWLVLDGYHFDENYQERIAGNGIKVLCADDYGHCKTWNCDAVLNQNLGAENWASRNSKRPDTKWLLGSSFALIREEFLESIREAKQKKFPPSRILVTLGGTDPENATLKILCALEEIEFEGLELRVLVGGANPHHEELIRFAESSRHQIEVLINVRDMPPMYEWADAVISAGGSTCWEWLAYGLPGAVVTIAENQVPVINELTRLNLACHIGQKTESENRSCADALMAWLARQIELEDFDARRKLIDGKGADRVASRLYRQELKLRHANIDDLMTYFEWVNDPAVRENSLTMDHISLGDHKSWFVESINSPSKILYIAENYSGMPVGQVRFELLQEGSWLLDYSIERKFRRQGLGLHLLSEALAAYALETGSKNFRIMAKVKQENIGSIKTLKRAGFRAVLSSTESTQLEVLELDYLSEANNHPGVSRVL